MTAPGAIRVEHATRKFRVYPKESRTLKDLVLSRGRARGTDVWALKDVSFQVEPGSAIGLVGRNGSGKTTLLRLLSDIIRPTAGRVEVGGRIGTLLELGAGFHPDFTGRENVFLNGSILGLPRWSFAFQSASPTGEPWLGPDILDELDELKAKGVERVLACPIGFVSDHLEILWDLDVEARERSAELGLEFDRIRSLNDDPAFVHGLAELVRETVSVPSA